MLVIDGGIKVVDYLYICSCRGVFYFIFGYVKNNINYR